MKYISYERLRELSENCSPLFKRAFKWLLHVEFQELDTLEVDKLRPMSEAPRDCSFLCKHKNGKDLVEGYYDSLGNIWCGDSFSKQDECEGWIPMPTLKPEQP
jgi:hypothetical protein